MTGQLIISERRPPIGLLRLNNADKLNALSPELLTQLHTALIALTDNDGVRVIVITGTGAAFSAGADIGYMQSATPEDAERYLELGQAVLFHIETMPIPVIAAINGVCTGGGCALAGACDLSLAAASARFGEPEARIGLPGGFGNIERLIRRVGPAAAADLLLTGRIIEAESALRIGLVARVVADDDLLDKAEQLGRDIAANAPTALGEIKRLLHEAGGHSIADGGAREIEAYLNCLNDGEGREGMRAFLEKRTPRW